MSIITGFYGIMIYDIYEVCVVITIHKLLYYLKYGMKYGKLNSYSNSKLTIQNKTF